MLSKELTTFKKWASIKREEKTIHVYSLNIKTFIKYVGDQPVKNIRIEDLINFHQYLKEKEYKHSTISQKLAALRLFFRFLGYSRKISWDYRLVETVPYQTNSFVPIEPDVAKKMIDSINTDTYKGLRDKSIFSLLYSTGVRVGELCDLKLAQIDLKNKKGYITSKKNKLNRVILWDNETNKMLKRYLSQREGKSDHVFVSLRGQVGLTTRSIQRLVCYYRRDKRITSHSFRHGFGVRAVKAGIHIRYIQRLMGHKSIESTVIYMNMAEKDLEVAYRKMC